MKDGNGGMRGAVNRSNRLELEWLEPRMLLSVPTVVSINRASPSGAAAEGTSVTYAVTFSEPVTGVTPDDFQLAFTGATTANSPLAVSPSSGYNSAYNVTVNGITGNGTLGLTLVDNGSIVDAPGKHLYVGGTFQSPQVYPTPGPQLGTLASTDLNGDGKLDLVTVNVASDGSGGKSLSLLLGDGDGTFQSQQTIAAGSGIHGLSVADLNGDGKMDLVTSNGGSKCVTVLLGNGNGTFLSPQTYATGGIGPDSVAVADFNGDGKLDLVVGDANGTNIHLLLGNGDGTFQTPQDLPTGSGAYFVATADLNGDGKGDLVTVNFNDNDISVLLGNGDGTFQPQKTFSVGSWPECAAVTDLNGDGIPDVAVVSNWGSVRVLLGNGDGTFQNQKTFPTGAQPYCLGAADFNGDGKPDLAVANSYDKTVSVLMGNGDGTFQSQKTFPTGTNPGSVLVGDFNGDGKPDLGVTVWTGVDVLLNGNTFPGQVYTIDQPAKLAFTKQPANTNAGSVINVSGGIKVAVEDSGGSIVSCDTSSVTLTLNGGTFASGTNTITVAAVNGVATFSNLIINTPGTYTVTAIDGALTQAVSQNFTVSVHATKLVFVQQPTKAAAGSILTPPVAVAIQDNVGNTDPTNNSAVTLTINSSTFASGSRTVTATAVNGVATFNNLIIEVAGSYTLYASDGNFTSCTSGSFAIVAAVATRLYFSQQPSNTNPGETTVVGVALVDPFGNTDLTNNSVVTLTLNGGTFAAGNNIVTASAVSGVATFSNLVINIAGKYTLTVSDGTLTGATSFAFTVGPCVSINRESPSGTGADFGSVTYTVTFGEPVTGVTSADFQLAFTGATTANSTVAVSPASGYNSVYHVTVNSITGYGTLGLNLVDNGSILDQAGNHLANATATFQAQKTLATGSNPGSVAVADLNGDGKQDLVTPNGGDSTFSVLFGNGDGTFQPQQVIASGAAPSYVAAADVNGDGKPDLIVANRGSNNVGVLLGNGDGTFQAQQTFPTDTWPVDVVVADVNGDGKSDLEVCNYGTVSIMLGNGDGTFQTQKSYNVGSYPRCVAAADLNGDGKKDLAVACEDYVAVLLGNGDGTFQAQNTFGRNTSSQYYSVAMADVNGDRKPDLVACDPVFGNAVILLGIGDGTFQTQETFYVGSEPISVAVDDINGDGRFDLITSKYLGYSLGMFLGNGDGTFQAQKTLAVGTWPIFVTAADVNRDGKPDLVACNQSSNNVSVLLANNSFTGQVYTISQSALAVLSIAPTSPLAGPGSVTYAVTFNAPVTNVTPANFQLAFTGGVSASSTVVVSPTSGYNSVYNVTVNNVTGSGTLGLNMLLTGSIHDQAGNSVATVLFGSQQNISIGSGSAPDFVVLTDLNGDGKQDMVVANDGGSYVSVLLGNGNGTFQTPVTYSTGYQPFSIAVADVNGDGKKDLVTANWGSNTVSVLLGNGNGTFQFQRIFAAGTNPRYVTTADVNGDGKLDLLVAASGTGVNLLLGNGDGTFLAVQTVQSGWFGSVLAADLNGDGKQDIVAADPDYQSVDVWLGNGNGTFQTRQQFTVGGCPDPYTDLAVADISGDGKLDILVANNYDNTASVLLGNGDGTFQTPKVFAVGSDPESAAVADFNGDGKLDLAVPNRLDNTVSVLPGAGDGTFYTQTVFAVGSYPLFVAAADLNGDGRADMVAANSTSDNVSVLLSSNAFKGQVCTIDHSTKLSFDQQPANTSAGIALGGSTGVQVAVENSGGSVISNDSSLVTIKLNGAVFADGGNIKTVAVVNGVATFNNLIINTAGTYTLTASDGALTGATSGSFTVYPLGDVNLDGVVNAVDIDQTYTHFGAARTSQWKLCQDGNPVNQADVDRLVRTVLQTGYGDTNMDRKIDFTDFQVLLDHWQNSGQGWANGDFTGNRIVDFGDFQRLLDNWNPIGLDPAPQSDGMSMTSAAIAPATDADGAAASWAALTVATTPALLTAAATASAPTNDPINLLSRSVMPAAVSMRNTASSGLPSAEAWHPTRPATRQLRHSTVSVQNAEVDTLDLLTQLHSKPVMA